MQIKPDGTKLVFLQYGGSNSSSYSLRMYTLNPAFSLTSPTYDSEVALSLSDPHEFYIQPDGSRMFILERNGDITRYMPNSSWWASSINSSQASTNTIARATYGGQQSSNNYGLTIKPDGTKMYVLYLGDRSVYEHDLSTPWDVSTGSYNSKVLTDNATKAGYNNKIRFSNDFNATGTEVFFIAETREFLQFSLSTAWDISTATHTLTKDVDVAGLGTGTVRAGEVDEGGQYFMWMVANSDPRRMYSLCLLYTSDAADE